MTSFHDRFVGCLLGALVGDAAALGLHWIYSDALVDARRDLASLAFTDPAATKRYYERLPSFFAHQHRRAGDPSHYGALLLLAIAQLEREPRVDSAESVRLHKRLLNDAFNVGGTYVGYVDTTIRLTLASIGDEVRAAIDAVAPEDGLDEASARLIRHVKVLPLAAAFSGDELLARSLAATRASHNFDAALAFARRVVQAVADVHARAEPRGQTEVSHLGALVRQVAATALTAREPDAALASAAVKRWNASITQTAESDALASVMHDVLRSVLLGASISDALPADRADVAVDHREFVGKTGRASYTKCGVPAVLHLLAQVAARSSQPADLWRWAIDQTIFAGGDSCGRGALVGAVLGAAYGVQGIPIEFVLRLSNNREVLAAIERL